MALYDEYEQFRDPNFNHDSYDYQHALSIDEHTRKFGAAEEVPGGFRWKTGKREFFLSEVTQFHISMAIRRAMAQCAEFGDEAHYRLSIYHYGFDKEFEYWGSTEENGNYPAMPEDRETPLRFPGVDPIGKYSVIDMSFAQREAAVRSRAESLSPEARAYVDTLLKAQVDPRMVTAFQKHPNFQPHKREMLMAANTHRILTRASKLCLEPVGRELLHQRAKEVETHSSVTKYDLLMQGIEYAAGIRTGPVPQQVQDFYRRELYTPLDLKKIENALTVDLAHPPEAIHMEFQDPEGKLLQRAFADPHNWGKSYDELKAFADHMVDPEKLDRELSPFVRATAKRVLDPIFQRAEVSTSGQVNRGDLIIIDGLTVREKMFADYTKAGGQKEKFEDFYTQNILQAASEYTAAALMAGKRVEAFVPDEKGAIPDQPSQLVGSGYHPSPLQPEHFNAWQRYFSRHGFYKEKVARQAEYERMTAARERVKLTNQGRQWSAMSGTMPHIKGPFVDGWFREHNMTAEQLSCDFSVTRSALHSFSVARMLMAGHSAEDIFDPNKLQAEKAAVGREVIEHLREPADLAWAGNTVFHGMRLLRDEMDRRTAGLDPGDEKQLFAQKLTFAIARVSFDLGQERDHCTKEVLSAAEQYMKEAGVTGDAAKYYDELHTGSNAASALFDYANRTLEHRALLGGGMGKLFPGGEGRIFTEMGVYETLKKGFSAARAAAPGKGICEYFTSMDKLMPMMAADAVIASSDAFSSLTDRLEADQSGEFHQKLGKEIMSGRFQQRLRIENRLEEGISSFDIAPPEKPGDTEVRTPQQLQAAKQQKTVQKQSKAPQIGPRL